jgi:hypothetical protein
MSTYDNEILTDPLYLQTKSYDAKADRKWFTDIASEGVLTSTDFALTLTSGLSFSIAAGVAWVKGDNVADQGMFRQYEPSAKTLTCPTAHATLPRLDQVILRIMDNPSDASTFNEGRLEVVPGTATSGATLDNRSGAANLNTLDQASKSLILLHDVLVPAGATTLVSGDVRDKRGRCRLGAGSMIAPEVIIPQASTVSGLGGGVNSKPTWLRFGSSPYNFVRLVYDAVYTKWIGPTFYCPLGKMTNVTGTNIRITTTGSNHGAPLIIPNFKDFWDAGLRPQIAAGARLGTAVATTVRGHVWCFNDGDTALVVVGPTGTLLNFAATASVYRASDWADLSSPTAPTAQEGLIDLEFTAASNIDMTNIGLWLRWVSA